MQITIENIAPRDAVSTGLLMHDIANFLQAFSLYLKSGSDVSAETEHRCSIPDDHIAPCRSALFMARSVLEASRDGEIDAHQAA
jgi:hypothetical protein